MPIINVRNQHHFGIISQKQRLEIQERMIHEAERHHASRPQSGKSQLETLEDFASVYGACPPEEKRKYDEIARTMIETVKRTIGYRTGGVGANVNLPFGWTKLTLLAQCEGWIQSECMDLLLKSLHSAPLNADQIPVLIYVAELMVYLLRATFFASPSDVRSNTPSGESRISQDEIKLLKVIEMALFRLFYFKVKDAIENGDVPEQQQLFVDQVAPLKQYLSGLEQCESRYKLHPIHAYSFCLIIELGSRLIRVDVQNFLLPIVTESLRVYDAVQRQSCEQQASSSRTANASASNPVLDAILSMEQEYSSFQMGTRWFESVVALRFLTEPSSRSAVLLDSLQRHASQSLHEWTLPTVYAYADMLLNVALHGVTVDIQQRALLGFRKTKTPEDAVAYFTNANLLDKLVSRTNERFVESSNADGDLIQLLIFGLKTDISRRSRTDRDGSNAAATSRHTGRAHSASATNDTGSTSADTDSSAMSHASLRSASSFALDAPFKVRSFALYCIDALRTVTFCNAMRDGINRFTLALVEGMKRYEPLSEVLRSLDIFNLYALLNKEPQPSNLAKPAGAPIHASDPSAIYRNMAQTLVQTIKKLDRDRLAASETVDVKKESPMQRTASKKRAENTQSAATDKLSKSATRPCKSEKPALSLKKAVNVASTLSDEGKTSFQSRVTTDLRRVIEDQWRKQLHRDLEADRKATDDSKADA